MAPHKGKRNAPSIMVAAYTATGLIEVANYKSLQIDMVG